MIIDTDTIKAHAPHLKVQGAYVQQPVPAIYGLEKDIIIGSNDADALYPISIMHQNIGYDTLHSRIYDTPMIKQVLYLMETVFEQRASDPNIIQSAIDGFTSALFQTTREYFSRKTVQKKKEVQEFIIKYYPELLRRILTFDGELHEIFEPKTDEGYILLQSCLFPILETVVWLSPQNRGYNQTIIQYVFFNDEFMKAPKSTYAFININSTRTQFKKLSPEETISLFKTKILNPYGVLFDKHDDNLGFDVTLIKQGLDDRRQVKNRALVLGALLASWDKIPEEMYDYFMHPENGFFLSENQADKLLTTIEDTQDRKKRIESLTTIEFQIEQKDKLKEDSILMFIALRESQFNSMQLGVKVTLNSLYGIYGLITWQYSSPIIGNSITTAGKIYGIKLFQEVTTKIIEELSQKINNGEYDGRTEYEY